MSPNACKAFARGKRKLEDFLQTDDGKKILRQQAKLHAGDEGVAKEAMVTMLKQKVLEKLRKGAPSDADSGQSRASTLAPAMSRIRKTGHDEKLTKGAPSDADSGQSRASTLAPAMSRIRKTGDDALQQWVHAVREDPKCQTAQFCEILRAVCDNLQRARKQNRVPDYAEIRSTIMERCDSITVWEQHHEKYVRRLIDTVQQCDE
jgi:hypothetical protein